MKLLVLLGVLLSTVLCLDGPCNSYKREVENEAYRECMYYDTEGHPTVGIGCNLDEPGARSKLESVGADFDAVKSRRQCLTDSQIKTLFQRDMDTAVSDVKKWISNWSSLGLPQQSALADMSFTMGLTRLRTFVRMKAAIERGDFNGAADEMKNSKWCREQAPNRCARDIRCMKSGIHEHL